MKNLKMKLWKNSWISRFIRYSNAPINKDFPWKLKRAMRLTKMSKFVAVVGDARLVRSRSIISQRVTKRKLRCHSRDKNLPVKFLRILRNLWDYWYMFWICDIFVWILDLAFWVFGPKRELYFTVPLPPISHRSNSHISHFKCEIFKIGGG